LLNTAFVWLLVHQLGFFHADGSLLRRPRLFPALMTLAGLAGLVLLTTFGGYPRSMVGTGFERISNMSPPTVCIIALALWQIGLAMLLRGPIQRWLKRRRAWMAVIWANASIMTIYLWHLTAYAIAYLIFLPTGWTRSTVITPAWWLQRLIWIAVPALILLPLIAVFNRFEREPATPKPREEAAAG
jgi:phosphoglycerol transferase MdoB-like AlkP superfamily enzyme